MDYLSELGLTYKKIDNWNDIIEVEANYNGLKKQNDFEYRSFSKRKDDLCQVLLKFYTVQIYILAQN